MERDWLNLGWKLLIARGVIGVLFGVIAMVWPTSTATALAFLWGFWALAEGIGAFMQAFQPDATGRVWLVLMGLVALAAAFFAIFNPSLTAATLTWILGIWLVVRGVFELAGAFSSSAQVPRWLLLTGSALSILLGLLFVTNPGTGVIALAFWLGLTAFVWGIAFLALGFMVRSEVARTAVPPVQPA